MNIYWCQYSNHLRELFISGRLINKTSITLYLAIVLSACTSTEPGKTITPEQHLEGSSYQIVKPIKKIANISLINGWRYLDSQAVILFASPKRQYLVTLRDNCSELNNSERIATSSSIDQLTTFDKLIVLPTIGSKRDCYVDALFLIEKEKVEDEAKENE